MGVKVAKRVDPIQSQIQQLSYVSSGFQWQECVMGMSMLTFLFALRLGVGYAAKCVACTALARLPVLELRAHLPLAACACSRA